ncbi:hypothetical protein RS694_18180 [Rhodoferax saidenbachensis]|uniref:Uncharacterized protein n=2 Tax=Rhodoferax saidenbachensis TaxID=1484693 RepID=A0A1P8KE31_9BURK|nr:hypothetical protein RS694_18180 [Rhodoferax saidenbachensis]
MGLVLLACGQVFSAAAQDRNDKQRRFEADRQACLGGAFGQSYESCMREAHAVRNERPGANPSVSPEQLERNSLLRCDALTGDEHTACVARIRGAGTTSGSVAAGGILRERVTTEVVPSPPQQPASSGASQ